MRLEKYRCNISITISFSSKISMLKLLTQQMKLDTIGIAHNRMLHTALSAVPCVMQRTFYLQFSRLLFTCSFATSVKLSSPVFSRASLAVIFPLLWFCCSYNLILANPKTIVREGSQGKSPCKSISTSFVHHMDSSCLSGRSV